ncbi:hypothetical protein [Tahibacter harae]|uniref:Minor tail protein n=1 Tax=Tahibacter harae TaxID=2963937 RepID=A0ABT1QS79_9GAMM|nr:hypothetical protein [Tahibacter harae]MCQ4165139.1 hypothetical protein [Tahibacter harae]
MTTPAVRQFAGDIRFWEVQSNGDRLPVIPEPTDISGNQPVETDSFTFTYTDGGEVSLVSKRRGAPYNQPFYTDTKPGTTTLSTTLLELPPLILARMLFGSSSTAIVSAGTATAVSVVLPANLDVPVQLAHRMLTNAAVTITNEDASVTYDVDDDYVIDRRRGQLIIPAGSLITASSTIKATYSYAAHVSTTIIGGATPSKKFYITGDMEDRVSGENGEMTVPQAKLTVDGEIDWLSSDPIQCTLTGPCEITLGFTSPYVFVTYKASA